MRRDGSNQSNDSHNQSNDSHDNYAVALLAAFLSKLINYFRDFPDCAHHHGDLECVAKDRALQIWRRCVYDIVQCLQLVSIETVSYQEFHYVFYVYILALSVHVQSPPR